MRHHSEDVTGVVEDAGDVPCRSVDRVQIAEGDATLAFQPIKRLGIGLKIAVVMSDRNEDFLAGVILRR